MAGDMPVRDRASVGTTCTMPKRAQMFRIALNACPHSCLSKSTTRFSRISNVSFIA